MSSLFYLNKYLLKYKWRLILGTVFIIISNIFSVQQPEIVGDAINEITSYLPSQKITDNDSNIIDDVISTDSYDGIDTKTVIYVGLSLAGLYMLLSILKGIFLFLTRQTIIIMSRFIEYDLKNEIYHQYQRLTFNFYKKNATGDLMNRISEDVSKVRMYLGPGIMYTINLVVLFCLVLYKMVSKNPELTLYVLLPLPIMSILIYYVSKILNKKSERVQYQQSYLSTIVQESFSGIRVIKSHVKEQQVEEKFNEAANGYKDFSMRLAITNAFFMPTITLLIGVSTILTIYIGGLQANNGEINPGEIAEFVIYVNMLTWPFASVGWVTSIVQHAAASQKRINEFLAEEAEMDFNENEAKEIHFNDTIQLENVSLTFENSGVQALKNINLTIKKGETIGIIGKTGSGKSALAYLIMRLVDPTSGKIIVDGKPLDKLNLTAWRHLLGYVPQEHFLFSDTIRNNIVFGAKTDEIDDATLYKYAENAGIHETIQRFPKKYDTILGERGINLSGGQKQRLSIARALIKKPEILVFDDCLSAVDNETEEFILQAIRKDLTAKTGLIISHRISSIKYTDKIIVLDNGELVEEGNHDELMKKEGIYFETYRRQEVQKSESES
ncbi:ABC transporter ATP-binding protein [Crocinitomix algicola]|uniref:ABC transporter ATP-binding protein n=1 Tax=Crocinitomix algicola TaxID=1740263 RepID=UPI0008723D51|nr:ABC transporter ATP-binding protein [Crocinitomix algicola]